MSMFMMLLPVVFLHFLIVFIKEKGEIQFPFRFLRYLYSTVAILFLPVLSFSTPKAFFFYQYSIQFVISFFLFGLLLNFFFLAYVSMKFRNEVSYLSTIIKTIWWALAVSFFPFAFLSFVPQFMGEDGISFLYTSWFVLFFPITFTYLILSKQLYDIDLVLRRFVFTTVISILPACVIVILIAVIVIFQQAATIHHLLLSFIFILMLLSFVMYSLEYFTTKLEAVMFPRKYHLQNALKKIAVNLQSISSFRELKDIILVDIVNTLQVFGAAIIFKYKDRMETVLEGDIETAEVERLISSDSAEHSSLRRFEINRHEEYTSYLIIARKRNNTFLGMEEVQWLNLIISYLAVSLENMHLISKLHMKLQRLVAQIPNEDASQDFIWFRKLMFELQEAERRRIATDLHDTTMQDLFFLKKRFSSIVDKLAFPKEDMERMRSIIDYVEIINTNLRQSCFELHPHLLYEIGLIRTINKIIETESSFCPFQLEFNARGTERIESWDMDSKRHFFRIIQELINNAKKHSQATKVSMTMIQENDHIMLIYEDDGIGFNAYKVSEEELEIGASGTGMEQMKSRVLYLDGQMDFRTSRGKGLQIWITVPLKEVLTA
ncbi:ATP-binding protein [Paenibacillus sp. RC67]|uniref:sensor histidine kinase n=1 Tax=Paenibacillus sp. RC67 TaxID=3039392 RepID=UPI0024AD879E|nr:ATP-binding protein [Paenibacillus sp. RC67]